MPEILTGNTLADLRQGLNPHAEDVDYHVPRQY